MLPHPVMNPSPGTVCSSIPKSRHRCVTSLSISSKEPSSSSSSMRSRAESFPSLCCRSWRASPPPCSAALCRRRSSSSLLIGFTVAHATLSCEPAMPVVISMLRGVNVGGHNRIKMDALCALYESLGLRNPRSHIQSGNVIFATEVRDLSLLTSRIGNAIERKFGFCPAVITRTTAELRDVIRRNPFAKRRGIDPAKLLVTFLASAPAPELRRIKPDPEELRIDGRELYIYFPNGMGRSKLPAVID